jgi:dTDP-4-amino-4,6-dideoxygalactose transaminase
MRVPFVDLRANYQSIKDDIDAAMTGVLDKTAFILGAPLADFEERFATFCGVPHAVGVGSGLEALALTLEALGVGPDDEVVLPANTFVATAFAASRLGARPVLVDCIESTANIDPDQLEAAITPRTKVIMPVHLFGRLADMASINEIAARHGIPVVEDAAQAHGAENADGRAGSFGIAAGFSFYPAKNLGAFGDGGAVVTRDAALAEKLRLLRSYGQAVKNRHDILATNSRLDALQAAILGAKLPHLDSWNAARRHAAGLYRARLQGLDLILPEPSDPAEAHVYHLFVVRHPARDALIEKLGAAGVEAGVHYPIPVHLQPAYAALGHGPGSFPVAERLASESLSLPMFPEITTAQVDRVCDVLGEALKTLV